VWLGVVMKHQTLALVGIDLGREPAPDETTVCKFRHLLERHGLGKQWHFGMKAHVGVDAGTKLIHSATATAANVADSRVLPELLHGEETEVWATRPVRARPRSSGSVPPRPKIVSTGATAPGESAIPKSAKRTARSPEPVRGSSTSSLSSNCASASPRFATEACSRTQTACSLLARWPTCSPPEDICCKLPPRPAPENRQTATKLSKGYHLCPLLYIAYPSFRDKVPKKRCGGMHTPVAARVVMP
jgi:hypothetical protein